MDAVQSRLSQAADRLGRALANRYTIERELGHGGMAVVYLAHDLKHGRVVALKVLRAEVAASLGTERFLQEIVLTAGLDHPHILALLDSGEADGLLYYVMPYVQGESLHDRLDREKRLPLDNALAIAEEVADALSYAHARGIVHRDIKPENILLGDGHARVADFGIARAITTAGSQSLTQTGVAVGTPLYMSPEQLAGQREIDARTDVYSLGCVLYEMVIGAAPYSGTTPRELLLQKSVGSMPPLRSPAMSLPDSVERLIMRALAATPEDRYESAAELKQAIRQAQVETAPVKASAVSWRAFMRTPTGLLFVAIVMALLSASTWALVRSAKARWARDVAVPEIQRLIDQRTFLAAFRLARRAEPFLANSPEFQRVWFGATAPSSIRTNPSGARVYMTDYGAPAGDWEFLGVSPIEGVRIPVASLRFKIEKTGFQTLEGTGWGATEPPWNAEIPLQPGSDHPGMIRVPGGSFGLWPALPPAPAELQPFWLDRYEVTNRAFKTFVDSGGYREQRYWTEPIVLDGRVVSWEQATRSFVDRTGRAGPSEWELGSYREGMEDVPVAGVSWYEAVAYCRFAGKRLPTLYHWYKAAAGTVSSEIILFSNLGNVGAKGPAAGGTYRGITRFGLYDMAGNVREWVLNPTHDRRYILGGSWNDPGYMFSQPNAVSPGDRSATNGFRCASYGNESLALGAELDAWGRHYAHAPVSEAVYRGLASLYSYDRMPLNARVDAVDDASRYWRRETISFDAAYGGRLRAHLFLPRTGRPPYQIVVYFPSGEAYWLRSSRDLQTWEFDFLVRTGRAVVQPVFEGTYERNNNNMILGAKWRDQVIHSALDIRQTIDYLATRTDIDTTRLAYFSWSTGAVYGAVFLATEPRFKVSALLAGGLPPWEDPPPINPANFAPHANVPVLMINGRDDFALPVEASQDPLFRLFRTPDRDKKHVILDGGHVPYDLQAARKEIIAWFDRYLGPTR